MEYRISDSSDKLVIFILSNDVDDCATIGEDGGVEIGEFDSARQTFEGRNGNNPASCHADWIFRFVNAIFLAL